MPTMVGRPMYTSGSRNNGPPLSPEHASTPPIILPAQSCGPGVKWHGPQFPSGHRRSLQVLSAKRLTSALCSTPGATGPRAASIDIGMRSAQRTGRCSLISAMS
eukprot:scaffold10459_cov132-Isochrysis_galbana.AAC.3